ncbi:MAG: hypothetical protein Q8M73_07825 [Actinomycetota bacterium]|nr:hypothetical protein [Actinomycetota bacterium]
MNPWQSAATEVEPGHRGLQAVEVDDRDLDVQRLVGVDPAGASQRVVRAAQVLRAAASPAALRIVLVRQHRDQDPQIGGTIDARIALVPAHNAQPAVAIAEGWILVLTVIVHAVLHRVQGRRIVVMIVLVVLLLVPVIPIAARAAVVTIVVVTIVPAVLPLGRVQVVRSAVAMTAHVPRPLVRAIPIVVRAVAAMIVVARTAPALAIRIVQIRAVVTIAAVMTVHVHQRRDPMIEMIVVVNRVQAATDRVVQHLVARRRNVVMSVRVVRLPGQPIAAMIGAGMIVHVPRLRAQAALVRVAIVMSVHAPLRLVRDIRIVVMNVVMSVLHVRQIAGLLDVRVTPARNVTIVVRALPCAVAMMAIRFVILVSQMTSRPRTLIAAC